MTSDLTAKIAALEALRPTFGDAWVDTQIAALHAQTVAPSTTQRQEAGEKSSIKDSPQSSAGGDMRDNALGSGNLVLHDMLIEAGGTLIIGARPADLPPQPEAVQQALAAYLQTLLERYQFLSLQGMHTGTRQQARIALRAVFINLQTNVQLTFADKILQTVKDHGGIDDLDDEVGQWLDELLSPHQRSALSDQTWPQEEWLPSGVLSGTARANTFQDIHQRLTEPRTALELIRHERALVLLGDPGSGKTTVLRHLALNFAHARLHADQPDTAPVAPELAWTGPLPLPILVQLRRVADDLTAPPRDAGPLLDHIEQVLTGDRLAALARHLQTRLEDGTVVLLLDGLDEVADATRRQWVVQAVTHFQRRFSRSRIVLTSRVYAYRDPCVLPPPFQVATLQPLTVAAQDDFVQRWYPAALLQGSELAQAEQADPADRRAADLIAALDRRPRLREIAANPLLLTMTALVHWSGMGLPQQRAELYERCLLLLLEQWEQRRGADTAGLAAALGMPDRLTTTGERLALIQPVAYQLQLLGREEAANREVGTWLLERFLDLAHNDVAHAKTLIDRFLTFLEGRSGLLIARDLRARYAFPHKTFQEYLAARELIYLGHQAMLAEVIRQRHTPTWREVILLVVGHLVGSGQPEQARILGWHLLEADAEGTPEAYRSLALAGELVEELGSNLGRDGRALRDEVIRGLVDLVQGGHLSARERVDAAFTLDRLGDPRLPAPDHPDYWCPIDAGAFWYGDDRQGKLQQVTLSSPYKIACSPVTNAAFAHFIEAGGYDPDQPWWTEQGRTFLLPGGHPVDDQGQPITLPRLWHRSRFNGPTQPVVGVSWYEAVAYCAWLTARGHAQGWLPQTDVIRLPTSLEWERAARHTDQRRYPWGNVEPDAERANYDETGIGAPAPVGCFPQGRATCGALDMAGNVMEWLATPSGKEQQVEPQKDFTPDEVVLRTYDDFTEKPETLCCGSRSWFYPFISDIGFLGFRIVWSPRSLSGSDE